MESSFANCFSCGKENLGSGRFEAVSDGPSLVLQHTMTRKFCTGISSGQVRGMRPSSWRQAAAVEALAVFLLLLATDG